MRGILRNSARIGAVLLVFALVLTLDPKRQARQVLHAELGATVDDINAQLAQAGRAQGRIYPLQRSRHA